MDYRPKSVRHFCAVQLVETWMDIVYLCGRREDIPESVRDVSI